jgi:hypothetical protein
MFAIIIEEVGGQMKKFIILLSVFVLAGCSNSLSSTLTLDNAVTTVLSQGYSESNINGRGFKYYKPRDFSLLTDNTYNHVLINNSNFYYLNIDINGYYGKLKTDYKPDSSLYYSNKFYYNDLDGYVEVKQSSDNYFYVKMMYNYSYIEVSVRENELKEAVINSAIILSSIRYNDKVIENFISNGDLSSHETPYELKKPEKDESNMNILEVIDYDSYVEE